MKAGASEASAGVHAASIPHANHPHATHAGVGGADAPPTEFHLPHGSWWPFWLANAIALLCLGLILFGRSLPTSIGPQTLPPGLGLGMLLLGVLALVGSLIGWFVQDFKWWASNTGTGLHIPKAGILLFIGSEIFLFGALFATYFTFKNMSHEWPDTHIELPLLKTAIFTLFLFSSSYTVHKAEGALKRGHHKAFRNWWLATIALGGVFLVGQVLEYSNLIAEGASLSGESHFMAAFFMLTGTHGLHVFGGLCALTVVYVRAVKGQFDAERHAFPQAASMYWHFVDIVWVVVFGVIYLANFL
ncbi:MAG: cytochrome c oxidase subunit 3 [Candidatus Thermoplasmatota archaeon]